MSWWDLFRKSPTANDIRVQLKETEHGQKKMRRDLDIKEREKNAKISQAKTAKQDGKQELLRDLFRELRQMEIANGYLNKDLRRLSLEKVALTALARKLEMLERRKDRKSAQILLTSFQESAIRRKIDEGEVDDEAFNTLLEEILGDEELALTTERVKEDAGFADFEQALDKMMKAEAGAEDEELSQALDEVERAIKSERLADA